MSKKFWKFPCLQENAPKPAGTLPVTCPFDGAAIGEVATAGEAHVEAALAAAHRLHRNRGEWLALHRRLEILEKLRHLMAGRAEELTLMAASEGGKPLADSRVEIHRAIDGIKLCIEHISTDHGKVIPMGTTPASAGRVAFTGREPIGVVVAVSAFNHPLNLIVHQAAAAVAAGCPVIVKPAHDTPLSALTFASLLHEAGLSPAWCQVVVADKIPTATRLVTDERVAFFSFIGSAKVGWMLRSQLAAGTRCALEHGGVAPVLLAADADQEAACAAIAKGGFYHAGQVCVSVQRVFAEKEIAREFAKKLADRAKKLKIGDPRLEDTEVGPLIRPEEVQRIDGWVKNAVSGGAELLCGGEPAGDTCYSCTVLFDPKDDAEVSREEIFGPVVCVYPCADLAEGAARANQLPVSFQAAVFTRDINRAMGAWRHLDASAVMVNDHTAFRVDGMPFAGLRHSGLGVGGIPHTIDDMQIEKMMVINSEELK